MAIGLTVLSTEEMYDIAHGIALYVYRFILMLVFLFSRKSINKGVAVETKHFLNDGLWGITRLL